MEEEETTDIAEDTTSQSAVYESPSSKSSGTSNGSGSMPKTEIKLSPTVNSVLQKYGTEKKITALRFVKELVFLHDDYATDKRGEVSSLTDDTNEQVRAVKEWLDDILALYDPRKVAVLHGRLVIVGLGLLDSDLTKRLNENGFLDAVQGEIKEALEDILSERGLRLYFNDAVASHTDHPARIDLLGRKAFAEALAIRLRRIAAEFKNSDPPQSFMLNLNGPWGAGKSSLLNFLSEALKKEKPTDKTNYPAWIVVDFNAWKHQRIGLPWWSLLDAVYRQSVLQLRGMKKYGRALLIQIREHAWRLRMGRAHYFLAAAIVFTALALVFYFNPDSIMSLFTRDSTRIESLGKTAESISKAIALGSAIITAVIAATRSLLSGSARAARDFMHTGHDPMTDLSEHFARLVDSIKQPVAIFIDDLDRCQSTYVVDLIEGIQTLCRDTAVTFVVAADRRWICSSYAKAYDSFASYVDEPGRPLGYLFLDKIFQLSTSIPRMSVDIQTEYWKNLLLGSEAAIEKRLHEAEASAKQAVRKSTTEAGIAAAIQKQSQDPYELQALRGAAVLRLASQEVETEIEHALKGFAPLLEPNPRAMKRLINAYAVQRAIATLTGVHVRREQLALWTIASLRWPLLTEYLEDEPQKIQFLNAETDIKMLREEKIPLSLQKLFQDPEVIDVFHGKGIGEVLDEEAIRTCASLRAAGFGTASVVA